MSVMMAHFLVLGYPDPVGWAAQVTRTCCDRFCVIACAHSFKGGVFLIGVRQPTLLHGARRVPDLGQQGEAVCIVEEKA